LLISGFVGVALSIPFLPPIDGGARFYTNAAAFKAALPAFGVGELLSRWRKIGEENEIAVNRGIEGAGVLLAVVILLVPFLFRSIRTEASLPVPTCGGKDEVPFVLQVDPGSYVDIVPTSSRGYGIVPLVGLSDFKANGAEPWDDFYQALVTTAGSSSQSTRLLTAVDLIQKGPHYFTGDPQLLGGHAPNGVIAGCAVEQRTQHQSIYVVRSVSGPIPSDP
jgi:hypothetical protein